MKRSKKKNGYALFWDVIIIAFGILIAYFLSKTGIIDYFVQSLSGYGIAASFIAGIFFTSAFTMAPASIALAHLSTLNPTSLVVTWGALGAMFGDLILLLYVEDRFYNDLLSVFKPSKVKKFFHSFHFGFMKWLSPLIGALIIASPLPDEIGVTLLGMSKVKLYIIIPIALVMNALGIAILIGFANLIS